MNVSRVGGGPWKQNSFLITLDSSAILIDPGGQSQAILEALDNNCLTLHAIINTHGHFDHIGAVQDIVDRTQSTFYISAQEVPIMNTTNLMRFIFKSKEKIRIPKIFSDLDVMPRKTNFGGISFELVPTPGHTPGGYCFIVGEHIFSGDTVLSSMPGSAELPGGDLQKLASSLNFLQTLPRDLVLHPGHGRDASLGDALDASIRWLESSRSQHD